MAFLHHVCRLSSVWAAGYLPTLEADTAAAAAAADDDDDDELLPPSSFPPLFMPSQNQEHARNHKDEFKGDQLQIHVYYTNV